MSASNPRWPDELPENMTEADYRALTEDISRSVEIVHGHVIKRESPVPPHNRIARRLCFALESARSPSDPCLTIETAADVVLWRVPRFTLRRPDVVVHECRDDPEIREFHLDAAAAAYRLHAIHRSVLDLEQPVRLTLPISELVSA
jgi:hypothetical protein